MPYKDPERQREYQRLWIAARRTEFFNGEVCIECGATDNLELHHVRKGEKIDHKVWSWALDRRESELAKCEVKCGECHDEQHAAERRAPCGTESAYWRGCRCIECRRAHRDGARQRRAA